MARYILRDNRLFGIHSTVLGGRADHEPIGTSFTIHDKITAEHDLLRFTGEEMDKVPHISLGSSLETWVLMDEYQLAESSHQCVSGTDDLF